MDRSISSSSRLGESLVDAVRTKPGSTRPSSRALSSAGRSMSGLGQELPASFCSMDTRSQRSQRSTKRSDTRSDSVASEMGKAVNYRASKGVSMLLDNGRKTAVRSTNQDAFVPG
jgi:hypothetical protein